MQEREDNKLNELLIRVCKFMEISPEDVYSGSRKQEIVAARKAIAIVGYFYEEIPQTEIGDFLERHPSTINHYCEEINLTENLLNAVRYLLNGVDFNQVAILAAKVSKNPQDKELRLKLKQLL